MKGGINDAIVRLGKSIRILSPFSIKAIGPPSAASGEIWPIEIPLEAPEKRPSVMSMNEEQEVLYEVTVYARYFMRSYPDDLFQYETMDEILESEWLCS